MLWRQVLEHNSSNRLTSHALQSTVDFLLIHFTMVCLNSPQITARLEPTACLPRSLPRGYFVSSQHVISLMLLGLYHTVCLNVCSLKEYGAPSKPITTRLYQTSKFVSYNRFFPHTFVQSIIFLNRGDQSKAFRMEI